MTPFFCLTYAKSQIFGLNAISQLSYSAGKREAALTSMAYMCAKRDFAALSIYIADLSRKCTASVQQGMN
jgi:hypothetical protein